MISTLLQECASPHPLGKVAMGLLNTLGMPFFRLLCAGERKDAHINVSSLFEYVLIDFKEQAFQP